MSTTKEGMPIADVEDPTLHSDLRLRDRTGLPRVLACCFTKVYSHQQSRELRTIPRVCRPLDFLVKIDVSGQCSVAELDTSWLCECCSHN